MAKKYNPYDEFDIEEPARGNTSSRRYVPISSDVEESAIPRRSSAKLVLSGTRQPARTQRDTEAIQQIKTKSQKLQVREVEPVQPKQPMLSRRNLLLGGGLVATACASVGGVVWMGSSLAITKWYEYMDQLNSGNFPSDSLSIVCGHNHDSNEKKTDLHVCALGDRGYVLFFESPAGDLKKGHVSLIASLRDLGYQGSLSNVSLQLTHHIVDSAHRVELMIVCRDVALLAEPMAWTCVLVDNGGYFHTPQPK